jgi:hypothetical protein
MKQLWHPAEIRHLPLKQQKAFLNGPVPSVHLKATIVDRAQTNIPDVYAHSKKKFLQLDDDFIAHVTRCAPYKRLPRGWIKTDHDDVFEYWVRGSDSTWIRECNSGWLIDKGSFYTNSRVTSSPPD